jgi:hypothetical protein
MYKSPSKRIAREVVTLREMIRLYCQRQHGTTQELCADCRQLAEYAMQRLEKCPFQAEKPTCAKCSVHCYKPEMRERVRVVMRFAGPRMLLRHPVLTVMHLVDGRREPKRQGKKINRKN